MANSETQERAYSFKKGWDRAPGGDRAAIKEEIMEALGNVTKVTFYSRLKGKIEPKVSEAETIEKIFNKYGVTDVWGE